MSGTSWWLMHAIIMRNIGNLPAITGRFYVLFNTTISKEQTYHMMQVIQKLHEKYIDTSRQ